MGGGRCSHSAGSSKESPTRENDAPICLRTFSMCDVGDYCKKLYWRLRRISGDTYPGRLVLIPAQLGCPVSADDCREQAVQRSFYYLSRWGSSCMSISKQHKMRLCAPRSIFQSSRRRPLLSIGCFTFEQRI